jgi:hypothetical protein
MEAQDGNAVYYNRKDRHLHGHIRPLDFVMFVMILRRRTTSNLSYSPRRVRGLAGVA